MKLLLFLIINAFLLNSLMAKEKLLASGHQDYPPFMWKDGDKIIGVGPEVITTIFSKLGIEVECNYVGPWKRVQRNIRRGDIDVFVAYKTKEREVYANFTKIYLSDDPTAVFVWKGREFKFEKWEDLIGKRGGGILGGSLGNEFDKFIKEKLTYEYVSNRWQNFAKLKKNRLDYAPTGLYAGLLQAKKLGYEEKIIALKKPILTEYLYLAISKKSKFRKYLPEVEKELSKLIANGTIKRLITKYIDLYIKKEAKLKKK